MRNFFPKDTQEASIWCQKCHKDTLHRIIGGRPAYCFDCQAKRENPTLPGTVEPEPEQMDMFEEDQ